MKQISYCLFLLLVLFCMNCYGVGKRGHMMNDKKNKIWQVKGAGKWFPGSKDKLLEAMREYVDGADLPEIKGRIVSALAPHAGYQYSGKVAGYTFKALKDSADKYGEVDTVVVLGFTHGMNYEGVALLDGDIIRTPLGDSIIDKASVHSLVSGGSRIFIDDRPHVMEHSAENEIPFVQYSLPKAKLVVGLIGDHDERTIDELVAAFLKLAKDKNIVVVASTDLLHDADYEKVTKTDHDTLALIETMKTDRLWDSWSYERQICCGIAPVVAAMRFAEKYGVISGDLLHYRNSGDDFPESRGNWVVGYGAVVFSVSD